MKSIRDESGQAAILAVLCLTIFMMGFIGLVTDVGYLLHAKRNLQIAADAAALAGANELNIVAAQPTLAPSVQAAGIAAAAQNGITCSGCVVIHNPPTSGPHIGNPIYVEAIVTQAQPTFLMRFFGFTSMPVAARAVAFNGFNTGSGCLNALNTSDADTIHLSGSFTLDAPGCQVLDESTSGSALDFTGGAGRLTAGSVGVVGGATGHTTDSSPAPQQVAPVGDPLAGQYTPIPQSSWPACTAPPSGNTWGTSGGTSYNPSGANPTTLFCYSGNISIKNTVTMDPGTYIFTGSLGLQGSGILQSSTDPANGVTIYLAGPNGNMNMGGSGTSSLSLTAPNTGPFANVAIYEESTDTNPVNLEGTPITTFNGIIYLPTAELELGGDTTQDLNADLIVNKLYDFGNADITITDYSKTNFTVLNTVALVE
ncbi:MAG TPA: pilus assembly protein TadG-related protein [Acidobacteriaceae bacterium]